MNLILLNSTHCVATLCGDGVPFLGQQFEKTDKTSRDSGEDPRATWVD